jgi:hypothetical protein
MGSLGGGSSSKSTSTSTSTSTVPRAPASAQEQTLGDIAAQQYADYVNRFQPLNTRLLDLVKTNVGRDVIPATARAGVDVRLAMKGKEPNLLRDGVRAGAGRALMSQAEFDSERGKAIGDAQGGAYRGAYDKEFAGLQKMAAQGRDIQDTSILSMSEAGRRATEAAIAKAGRNLSSSGTSSEKISQPLVSGSALAGLTGAIGNGISSYLFGPPTFGNVTTGAGLYDSGGGMLMDLGGMAGSSGGFFDSIGSGLSSIGSTIGDGLSAVGSSIGSSLSGF